MNPVINAIVSRRTVKVMRSDAAPSRDQIEAIVEAATWAPNHHLTEPWRFVVITGDGRKRLAEAIVQALANSSAENPTKEQIEKERNKPLSAPVIVVLISSPKSGRNIVAQEEIVAAGAALQNMLLAAYSLGLASMVRTGTLSYSKEVRNLFEMKETESLIGMVYLGFSSGPPPPGRRTDFRGMVTWLES
jgi:nitroreductase